MFTVISFCIFCISYTLYKELDSRTTESIVEFSFLTIITTMGSYVFGAVWQDNTLVKNKRREREKDYDDYDEESN